MSFPFLSRGGTIARRAIRRSERCRRATRCGPHLKLPGCHRGSNVERRCSKRAALIALLALGWSGVALVAQSKAQAPDPHALGMTEAVFDYCAKADPKGAAKVRARLKRLVQGAGREKPAKERKSDGDRKARRPGGEFVAQVGERKTSRGGLG